MVYEWTKTFAEKVLSYSMRDIMNGVPNVTS